MRCKRIGLTRFSCLSGEAANAEETCYVRSGEAA
jgi:hypothetical protein